MSRIKNIVRAVSASYVATAANILYTGASIPLALHYLSKAEFGLWAVAMQLAGYAFIVDFGMSTAFARTLIDHKDDKSTGLFGATITTGSLVSVLQGLLVFLIAAVGSPMLARLMDIPAELSDVFRILVVVQSGIIAFTYATRACNLQLYANQRQDIYNYISAGIFLPSFLLQWLGFALGWGVISMLISNAVCAVLSVGVTFAITCKLSLWPKRGQWGSPNRQIFWEMFGFGKDVFLLTLGGQLLQASQVVVVTRIMGLEAAAVWAVCNKTMAVAQQLVCRVFDFSEVVLSEMYVRKEFSRLVQRFQDIVTLTASMGVFAAVALAVCNGSFVWIWTSGKVGWNPVNDWLLGAMLLVFTTTRCHTSFVVVTKVVGMMKYIYFAEGVVFVGTAILLSRQIGFPGLFIAAITADLLFSGAYGTLRTARFGGIKPIAVLGWLRQPLFFLAALAGPALLIFTLTRGLAPWGRFMLNAAGISVCGSLLFWKVGLSQKLRIEVGGILKKALAATGLNRN